MAKPGRKKGYRKPGRKAFQIGIRLNPQAEKALKHCCETRSLTYTEFVEKSITYYSKKLREGIVND